MFSVKVVIVFPAVLCSVTLFTCRLDGCDVFFSSYIQCSFSGQGWSGHPSEKRHHCKPRMENDHFNVITDSEALPVEIELQNGDKVILATIYCPNRNPC